MSHWVPHFHARISVYRHNMTFKNLQIFLRPQAFVVASEAMDGGVRPPCKGAFCATELDPKSGENRFESLLCVEVTCYLSHSGMQYVVLPSICQKQCLAHTCWSTRAGQVGARGPTWDCWWSKAGDRNLQELIKTVDIIVAGTNISRSPVTGQIFSIPLVFEVSWDTTICLSIHL